MAQYGGGAAGSAQASGGAQTKRMPRTFGMLGQGGHGGGGTFLGALLAEVGGPPISRTVKLSSYFLLGIPRGPNIFSGESFARRNEAERRHTDPRCDPPSIRRKLGGGLLKGGRFRSPFATKPGTTA